jgi:hypothetical protein
MILIINIKGLTWGYRVWFRVRVIILFLGGGAIRNSFQIFEMENRNVHDYSISQCLTVHNLIFFSEDNSLITIELSICMSKLCIMTVAD